MSLALIGVITLIIGICILIYSADRIVDAGIHMMHLFELTATTVGVLVIALSTSMPELFVSAIASFRGSEGLAYSEVLGSNTANIPLIFGLSILVGRGIIIRDHFIAKRDAIYLTVCTAIVGFLMSDLVISRMDGFIMLALFGLYIYIVRLTDDLRQDTLEAGKEVFHRLIRTFEKHSIEVQKRKTIFLIILSAIGLFVGALITVRGAEDLTTALGISPIIIGLIAVAIGTTLPETAASLTAIRRGQTEMGIGNILGDNISSILLALGVAAVIRPMHVEQSSMFVDFPAVMTITTLFMLVLFWKKKVPLWIGISFLVLYVGILGLYMYFHA